MKTLPSVLHGAGTADHILKTVTCIPSTEAVTWAELPAGSDTRLDPLEASADGQAIIYLQRLQPSWILAFVPSNQWTLSQESD